MRILVTGGCGFIGSALVLHLVNDLGHEVCTLDTMTYAANPVSLASLADNPRHAIVRTAWVVSPHRGNFVKTTLRLAAERDALTVVDDQHGCPTSAADLAAALAVIARRLATDAAAPTGTFHCVNAGDITWRGFAEAIVAGSARRGGCAVPVKGIPTSAYPTPARRPANSRLSTDSLTAAYGVAPRPWQAALDDILDRLVGPVTEGVSKP